MYAKFVCRFTNAWKCGSYEQKRLQEQIPALDTCEEAIPAVVVGTYDFPLELSLEVSCEIV